MISRHLIGILIAAATLGSRFRTPTAQPTSRRLGGVARTLPPTRYWTGPRAFRRCPITGLKLRVPGA